MNDMTLDHASAIVACDFCVVVTATIRLLYVLVVIEHGSRRLIHYNVTAHPTAEWTLQQLREAIPCDHPYRFLIHDRDSIFSAELDRSIVNLGLRVLKTPYRSPQANSICERVIGSMRREFLHYVIPFNEAHLRKLIKNWKRHYNRVRPHSSLGPSVPDPPTRIPAPIQSERHRIDDLAHAIATPVLGGLHHDYALASV